MGSLWCWQPPSGSTKLWCWLRWPMVESKTVGGPTSKSSVTTNASVDFRLEKGEENILGSGRSFWVIKGFLWQWLLHSSVFKLFGDKSHYQHTLLSRSISILSIFPCCEQSVSLRDRPFPAHLTECFPFWGMVGHPSQKITEQKHSRTCRHWSLVYF